MQKADPLIRTKLRLPFTRPGRVSRPRLQEQIAQGLCGPLTLITAPAGFGKTTLVASCVAACAMPVAWLSLDSNDNETGRFLSYLVAALQEADAAVGSEAAQLLAAPRQASPQAILISLINDLDTAGGEIALVLDDYQFISTQAVHDEVAFLLEHCPKPLHLVIATRSDPPLPLSRLRARGQTVELRAAELRFTEAEAAQFLNEVMGLGLDAGSVVLLEERTEGWIAGLQMAALSMRGREDVRDFIEGFSGTNRYILDYLLEEVLAGQPSEVQRFLLCTSILERLTAPLCDAVLASSGDEGSKSDGGDRPVRSESPFPRGSAAILEYLERANLFLVPLDDERSWYRYHHLFADLLRARLQQIFKVQDIAVLHTRAGQWYERNGLAYEAIHHASLTSDNEWVEHLIEQNYIEMFRRGETAYIRFLTGKLSRELVHSRPWLCIYEAESHAWFGELDEADALLAVAEKHIRSGVTSSDTRSMLGHLGYIKSRVAAIRGDLRRAIDLSRAARENTPTGNQALLGGISAIFGYAHFLDGDFANAIQGLNETIQSGISAGVINTTIAAYCVLARIYAVQGQLHRSYEAYQEAKRFIREVGGRHLGGTGIVEVGIAGVLYEWNDLEAALTHVKQGLELIVHWSKADDIALGYTTLARILQARGHPAAASEAIEKASEVIRTSGVFSETREAVVTTEIGLWLAQGNRRTSSLEQSLGSGDPSRFENELAHMTLARVYIAQNKLDECLGLLSRLETGARTGGRTGRLIGILILKALAMQKSGESARTLSTLVKSLALAEPEGYVRVFVDEGETMRLLLVQWLAHAGAGSSRDYAIRLLSQFDPEAHRVTAQHAMASAAGNLVEPLSPRELEVLQLIALGKTNQEIARQLIVSPGTVKAHTASIYRKLDVANRTEAVARARQLRILP